MSRITVYYTKRYCRTDVTHYGNILDCQTIPVSRKSYCREKLSFAVDSNAFTCLLGYKDVTGL
jgi:hypothetical protein